MHPVFKEAIESLVPKFDQLIAMEPVHCLQQIPMDMRKKGGVYLFSEDRKHLYVGRTSRIRERYSDLTRPSSDINTAPFAMLLARKKTGITRAYSGDFTRKKLVAHPKFAPAFEAAKDQVRKMSFRYVVEKDDVRQALLECYVAVALRTEYNDFGNH